ncbi:C40 family peptidase [Nocardioides terrisoli]|uniref:C40 family peptidase n=1 Tax=Nocardioides terrisoli TaxID=3388267 RepID=UPI00287B92C4|nr:NlpC/P60 family protein [Nocardioides marmorisolisilvae]
MHDGRKRHTARKIVAAAFATALSGTLVCTAAPATAKPNVDTVQQKVDKLFHQAEIASEHYNSAKMQLHASSTTLKALSADLGRQRKVVDQLRQQVATMVVQQYQGQALSTATQLALSDDPSSFLDQLNTVSAYNSQRGEVMHQYGVELSRLKLREKAVGDEAKALTKTRDQLAADKADIDKRAAAAKQQLDQLQAEQRQQFLSGDYSGPVPSVNASGRAAAAVRYALAQVGKAYVYGAAGPSAFDCSGLTMRAWGAAGVGLPHSSNAQQGYGTRVSESQLQPGDLVFYYSPVSHVGMYIGNGLIVNAENPSVGVKITGLHSMPYSGAVRPG